MRESDALKHVEKGARLIIYPDHIHFPEQDLVILTGAAATWEAPPATRPLQPVDRRKAHIQHMARLLGERTQKSQVSRLLPVLAGLESEASSEKDATVIASRRRRRSDLFGSEGRLLRQTNAPRLPAVRHGSDAKESFFQTALTGRRTAAMADALAGFLGVGSGLTPSGDDLILGFCLALKRWGRHLAPDVQMETLRNELLSQIYKRTTTLSANLIECALQGQANERLILALDGIITGEPDAAACADSLAGWGNTSGIDALVGMIMCLNLA
jgi:hypothetical protein